MAISRYYDESKNEEGRSFGGVPLGDISDEQWESYPDHLKASIDAADFYRKTPVPKAKPARKTDDPPAVQDVEEES